MKGLFLLGAAFLLWLLTGCSGATLEEAPPIRLAAMRGPTALGMLQMMETGNHDFTILGMPDQLPPLLVRGEVDVAAVPSNLAAILHNNPDIDVVALAVVTLGVLHVVDTTGEIAAVEDLVGRTVFVSGQGAMPEFALNYVLSQHGLTPGVDVHIEFRAEHTEIAAMLEAGTADVALLPEPFVSTVMARVEGLHVAIDLTQAWQRVQPQYDLIMSVVIARRSFVEANPTVVAALMDEYAASVAFVTQNPEAGAGLAVDFDIIPSLAIGKAALPRTHITFMYGRDMMYNLTGFYHVLYTQAPQSIGGSVPDETFFYMP